MARRLTQAERDARIDNQKWEAILAFTRANNALREAVATYGMMSPEVGDAVADAQAKLREVKRLQKL